MKFWFCETCGKRLTDKDIDEGLARNKKLKGVFCKDCAVGVMTMEMIPLSESAAKKLLKKEGADATPATATPPVDVRAPAKTHAAPRRNAESLSPGILIGGAVAAVVVLVVVVLATSSGKSPVAKAATKPAPAPETQPPTSVPIAKPEPVPIPEAVAKQPATTEAVTKQPATMEPVEAPKSSAVTEPTVPATPPIEPATTDTANIQTPAPEPPGSLKEGPLKILREEDFSGGTNARKRGKSGRAIWSTKSKQSHMQAQFRLARAPAGAARLLIESVRHERKEPCKIAIEVNGSIIFEGADPSEQDWAQHAFNVPPGLLVEGENKLVIYNREDGGPNDTPCYMIQSVEIRDANDVVGPASAALPAPQQPQAKAKPADELPPIMSDANRQALQFYDKILSDLRNQQTEGALRAARAAAFPEAKPLAALLERAAELRKKAIEAIGKKPPSAPIKVRFKGEDLTGQLKRIEGDFAWVLAKGLEVRVGVDELPGEIMQEALAINTGTAEGQRDVIALNFSAGRSAEALAAARKLTPPDAELLAMLDHQDALRQRAAFEKSIAAIEALIAESKVPEAQSQIASLRRNFPALSSGEQAARLKDLDNRAVGAKLSTRIRELFKGAELLAFRNDMYIELKYDFTGPNASREDFSNGQWSLTPNGLHYTQRYVDSALVFKAPFQAKPLRFEILQGVEHDYTHAHLGKVITKVRWPQGPLVHTVFGDKYTGQLYQGKLIKQIPPGKGFMRYAFERTETESVFSLDQVEYNREKLPAEAATETSLILSLTPSRAVDVKEIVIKGCLDKDWVQEALKKAPAAK